MTELRDEVIFNSSCTYFSKLFSDCHLQNLQMKHDYFVNDKKLLHNFSSSKYFLIKLSIILITFTL